MTTYSTREVALLLGISPSALSLFVKSGRVTGPKFVIPGKRNTHLWTEEQVARIRKRLPKLTKGTKIGQKYRLARKGRPIPKIVHKKRGRKPKKKTRGKK
jgi:predicted transcriptional regulator